MTKFRILPHAPKVSSWNPTHAMKRRKKPARQLKPGGFWYSDYLLLGLDFATDIVSGADRQSDVEWLIAITNGIGLAD